MNRVTDRTLLEDMLSRHTFPQAVVKHATKEILEIITEGLIKDGAVTISRFGSFRLKTVAARRGINPQTGATLTIASHRRVIFTPSKTLRDLIEPNPLPPILLASEKEGESLVAEDTLQAVEVKSLVVASATGHGLYHGDVSLQKMAVAEPVMPTIETHKEVNERQQNIGNEIDLGVFEYDKRARNTHKRAWGVALIALLAVIMAILMTDHESPEPSISVLAATSVTAVQLGEPGEIVNESVALVATDDMPFFKEQHHHVAYGESLWQLAENYYHEPLLWPYIFKANKASINNPDYIHTGADIIIPALQGTPDSLNSEDKRLIAESYYLLFEYYSAQNHHEARYAQLMARHYERSIM